MSALVVSRLDEQEMIQTLKQTVCKGATDAQFHMFVEICKATGLNPLLKEIWFVPGVGIIAARDGYLRVANEHPQFDGMSTHVDRDEKNVPIKATCTVWRKDRNHPTICEAYFSEYRKSSGTWNTYPSAMISKVAEVLALKRSFSINGVVSEEEMGPAAAPPTAPNMLAIEGSGGDRTVDILRDGDKPPVREMPAPPKPAPQADPVPPPLQAMYKILASTDKFAKLDVFKELKESLFELMGEEAGELKYREILNHYGVQKSNEFKGAKNAQCAARDMYLAIQKAVAPVAKPFEVSDADLPENLRGGGADLFGGIQKESSYGTD